MCYWLLSGQSSFSLQQPPNLIYEMVSRQSQAIILMCQFDTFSHRFHFLSSLRYRLRTTNAASNRRCTTADYRRWIETYVLTKGWNKSRMFLIFFAAYFYRRLLWIDLYLFILPVGCSGQPSGSWLHQLSSEVSFRKTFGESSIGIFHFGESYVGVLGGYWMEEYFFSLNSQIVSSSNDSNPTRIYKM